MEENNDEQEEQQEQQIIARSYQVQLEEIANSRNTIIHLPTGSGKTFIAIQLIKRFIKDVLLPWGEGGKRTFFLVNNVPLVQQQKKVIEKLCPVTVGGYSSEDKVDHWNKEIWDQELSKNEVIVMTGQILSDMLTHCYIRIEDINLIIFDECHHAVEDHMMRAVMRHFENCDQEKQPRVLGLTATLLNGNVVKEKVERTLKDLETTFHATIATAVEMAEVLRHSANPQESLVTYKPFTITPTMTKAIEILLDLQEIIMDFKLPVIVNPEIKLKACQRDISIDPKKIVKIVKNMVEAMIRFMKSMGTYGGSLAILAYVILLERLKRKASSEEEQTLYQITITHSTMARMILLKIMENETGYEKILKHSSEQILGLLNILKEYNPVLKDKPGQCLKYNTKRQDLCAIVFTRERFTAKILYNLIKEVQLVNPEEFDFIKHDFITSFHVSPMKTTREDFYNKKVSQAALLRFSNRDLNCLISTSVIEEGIDIPQCLLVVRFDPPLEYRSYIQSKGRARSKDANYIMQVDVTNKKKFLAQYANFQLTERYIVQLLVGKSEDRTTPTKQDISKNLYNDAEIPPYITPEGARLSAHAAVNLLNRYCSQLPHDAFTLIMPTWLEERDDSDRRKISIIMPLACPIKEPIEGIFMPNRKTAKRSAALNACIKLHQQGELEQVSLLPKKYGTVNFKTPDMMDCFPNWPLDDADESTNDDMPKPGTKKRKRKHPKVFSSFLNGPKRTDKVPTFYLHIIKIEAAFPEPTDSREKALYKLLKQDKGYGFLTANPLPKLCDFPMFLTVGEVQVTLQVNYAVIPLSDALFQQVNEFHYFIFSDVLSVAKRYVVFDGTENCMYVVPVVGEDDDIDIDWETIQAYKEIPFLEVPTFEQRKEMEYDCEEYKHAVVTPWYRTVSIDRYIVSNVLEYMTPDSTFGSGTYTTYAEYFENKYNLTLVGKRDQPLLEVRKINSRMNCLLPRAVTLKALTEKQQKLISAYQGDDNPKGFAEIFIPEYCTRYDFPGVFWYKAMMLPSIIHRVSTILVAHELRMEITLATKYGKPWLGKNDSWKPLIVDEHVVINSLKSNVEEPAPTNSIDRINQPVDPDSPKPPALSSMKENIYRLQHEKLNKEYPWDAKLEPIDIERNITSVTVMDVECYDEFVCTKMVEKVSPNIAPAQESHSIKLKRNQEAILPAPLKYDDKIGILDLKPEGLGPELRDIVAALTTINSQDSFNLERAEFLGDAFLKFACSLYLFHKFPELNEGQLTSIKCRLIGNRNLYYAGAKKNIGGRMKVEHLSPMKDFLVPGYFAPKEAQDFIEEKQLRPTFLLGVDFTRDEVLTGDLRDETMAAIQNKYEVGDGSVEKEPLWQAQNVMQGYIRCQVVPDKVVADCVEAIIGTYIFSGGIVAGVRMLEWFNIVPPKENLEQLLHKKPKTVCSEGKATIAEVDFLLYHTRRSIEKILDYNFKDPAFLLEALSHQSYIRNRLTRSYERLEFLGDAILDFLITSHIYENSKNFKPGELTDLRSALVNNVTFASYVVKLGLHRFMCSQVNPALDKAIINFVEHQEQREHQIVEEVLYLITEDECLAEYVEVPKVLSDIFESLVGAIYLDSGGDLSTVWKVVYRIMHKEINAFSARIPVQPVRMLYENKHACAVFGSTKITDTDVVRVMIPVTFTKEDKIMTVYGFGGNKFQAKRAAAKLALKFLNIH